MSEHVETSDSAMKMVRASFNPSGEPIVHEIKLAAARLITLIEQVKDSEPRTAAIAITHVQTASMFAVFAATARLGEPRIGPRPQEEDTLDA